MLYPKNLQCPVCKKERDVDYRFIWRIKKGTLTARCLKCSRFKKGQTNSGGFKKGSVPWNKGQGKSSYWKRIKASKEWKEMRRIVFERDNYTCQICGQRGGELNPDHIKPKTVFPELVFDVTNVRTLCRKCHRKTDTYGYKAKQIKNKLQAT